MSSKHFFSQFKNEIEEEHEKFDTFLETSNITNNKCNHYGKVRMLNNELRCQCGAGWTGPGIDRLFDLFTGDDIK